jgi:hypothetical protein
VSPGEPEKASIKEIAPALFTQLKAEIPSESSEELPRMEEMLLTRDELEQVKYLQPDAEPEEDEEGWPTFIPTDVAITLRRVQSAEILAAAGSSLQPIPEEGQPTPNDQQDRQDGTFEN